MILLWGLPGDEPFDFVRAQIERGGAPHRVLDQRRVLEQSVDLHIAEDLDGAIRCGDERIAMGEVQAAYTRVYDVFQFPAVAKADPQERLRIREMQSSLWTWIDTASGRIVNRPSRMDSNSSKPYQAAIIAQCGFLVPETLITTDPQAALEFWDRHGTVIYKSVSGVRSIVSRLGPEHRARMRDVESCPTQFQAYVPGRDVRVHVVGDEVFPCEIVTDAVDYRYARQQGSEVELSPCPLPRDVADRCRHTAATLGLPLAGLDLRRTPEGAWYCFEVNPSPCFTYYERHTGLPIAAAVAAYLANGHR